MSLNNIPSRKSRRAVFTPGLLLLLAGCVLIAAAGGVNLVLLKYRIETVNRSISETEARTQKHANDIETEKMRFSQLVDRYAIREALSIHGSALEPRENRRIDTVYIPDRRVEQPAVALYP